MKLHVIRNDPRYLYPLLMLSDYVPADVDRLCLVCRDLAARRIERFALHEQPWIDAVGQCRFFWEFYEKDIGVEVPAPGEPFVLRYSDEAWLEVEGKLQAVREPRPDQLHELTMEGDVQVIISPDGRP